MPEPYIYHICTENSWSNQKGSDVYIHDSLRDEGFIHCSKKSQIDGVMNRYFKGQQDLLVLTIDTSKLDAQLVYEMAPIGEMFPHIYDPINKSAITEINILNDKD